MAFNKFDIFSDNDKKILETAVNWELKNGNVSGIGETAQGNFLIKFRRAEVIDPDKGERPEYKDSSLALTREELDSIISMYFEDYSLGPCEAVLIHKLLLKRGFSHKNTLQTAKVIQKAGVLVG